MRWLPSIWYEPSPRAVLSSGTFVIHAGFGLALALVLFAAWLSGPGALIVPAVVLTGVLAVYLFKRPLINLAVVIGSFVAVAGYEEGIQVTEILFGLYYFTFIGHWFLTRLFVYEEDIVSDTEDKIILALLVGITLSIPLTFLFGGEPRGIVSEWTALMLLALYFPVKEACIRHEYGAKVVTAALLGVGLFAAARNGFLYRDALSDAQVAVEIATGRVYFNDNILMASSLITLTLVTFSRTWKQFVPLAGLFLILLTGLILTLSRAFWIAFVFGAGIMFLLVDWKHKRRLLIFSAGGFFCFIAVMMVFYSDYFTLIFAGLADRLGTLSTAITNDLSLINRFRESRAVFGRIIQNPILGYGMGVPYTFFDLVHMATDRDAFVHNAYLGVWYKFGIWGLLLVLCAWYQSIRQGIRTHAMRSSYATRTMALAAGVTMCALALGAITSNPLFLMDGTLLIGVLTGLASGTYRKSLRETGGRTIQRM